MRIDGGLGIVGGGGQLGGAIARAVLDAGLVAPDALWISSRSGQAAALSGRDGVRIVADNRALVENCATVILSVPPAQMAAVGINAGDRLVISVMAGVTLDRIARETGATRVIRAMSSPAAAEARAYSPWIATPAVSAADRSVTHAIFSACGLTDEVTKEGQIDLFTAMTGPVPGFVALFADCMVRYATESGVAPEVADRAVRQLFLASGEILARGKESPADQVRVMVDYAGTTAAGLIAMEEAGLERTIFAGLDAAVARARTIGEG